MIPFNSFREYSSFRDPSGTVYQKGGILYRQIEPVYFPQYRRLMSSGLYDELRKFNAIVAHEEVEESEDAIIICPERIPFISYPYEWSFGQLKDAALLTLKIHRRAMRHNMMLKDASAYNIQFRDGYPILIDTLSFDDYKDGEPWGAYGQFCRHFLAPLLLMREKDVRLNGMLKLFIDGIPLDMAASLLGGKGGLLAKEHIIWHAKSIARHNEDGHNTIGGGSKTVISKKQHLALVESLIRNIEKLKLNDVVTEWGDYYAHTNYTEGAAGDKRKVVSDYLSKIEPKTVWDFGANDGTYSKLALSKDGYVVAFDIDPIAVERNYNEVKRTHSAMLPLVLDLTNPSPGIGFANRERKPLADRQSPDCILALAVVHHLAISNNLPLSMIAEWLSTLSNYLIIEFVPKEDSQVQILLSTRRDIFPNYTEDGFEKAFSTYYSLCDKQAISHSKRSMYLWKRK